MRFISPHRRYLYGSFAAALGVMVFYTAGMGALLPILEAMTSDFETLSDWIYRELGSHRLGVAVVPDVPRDKPGIPPDQRRNVGIRVARVGENLKYATPPERPIEWGDTILSANGANLHTSCYELYRTIVRHRDRDVTLTVQPADQPIEGAYEVTVRLRQRPFYASVVTAVADSIDFGASPAGRLKSLAMVMAVFVAITTLQLICRFGQQYLVELTAARALMDLRIRGYSHVLQLPMPFFSQRQTGETLTRFAHDTNVLLLGIRTLFGKAVREPLKATGVVIFVLVLAGPKLLLIMLAVAIPAAILIRTFGRIIRRSQRRALRAWDTLLDLLQERIAGIRVVKGYTMERAERLRFFREHRRLFDYQLRVQRFDIATGPILEFMATLAVTGFILYGGSLVFYGTWRASAFLQAVVLLVALFDPLRKLSNVNNRLQQAEAAAGRIFDILDEPVEAQAIVKSGARDLPRHRQQIEFRNVSFRYPNRPDVLVLRDINLTVQVGETIAIVGPNGSGKTTLCALLLRFYNPSTGSILIDGNDLRDVRLESLRRQIGLVTQDTVIFTDTVLANIAYGQRHIDEELVRKAARAAYADEFITHLRSPAPPSPNGNPPLTGYNALITTGTLSGGQKQRIAISRALLRDPAILIFDEATSQIDPDSARKIHDAIRAARQNRTAFLIAHHDRDMLAEADRVVVMDQGRIVAMGTHGELLASSDLYRSLYETQFTTACADG